MWVGLDLVLRHLTKIKFLEPCCTPWSSQWAKRIINSARYYVTVMGQCDHQVTHVMIMWLASDRDLCDLWLPCDHAYSFVYFGSGRNKKCEMVAEVEEDPLNCMLHWHVSKLLAFNVHPQGLMCSLHMAQNGYCTRALHHTLQASIFGCVWQPVSIFEFAVQLLMQTLIIQDGCSDYLATFAKSTTCEFKACLLSI